MLNEPVMDVFYKKLAFWVAKCLAAGRNRRLVPGSGRGITATHSPRRPAWARIAELRFNRRAEQDWRRSPHLGPRAAIRSIIAATSAAETGSGFRVAGSMQVSFVPGRTGKLYWIILFGRATS